MAGVMSEIYTLNHQETMDKLDEKERQEFSRKLILPPVNKLKTMIDELY